MKWTETNINCIEEHSQIYCKYLKKSIWRTNQEDQENKLKTKYWKISTME